MALLLAYFSFAQSEKGHVYLKNGTILKGKYQYTDAGKLRVESAGNIWVFDAAEIDSVAGRRASRVAQIGKLPQYSRIFYRTELGVLAGNSQNSRPRLVLPERQITWLHLNFLQERDLAPSFLKNRTCLLF
jgi:hypothetical protein